MRVGLAVAAVSWVGLSLGTVQAADAPATPAAAPDPFWTAEELARIDRGLEVLNLDRKDLGFSKRPLDDPFRLDVVNRVLDDPLSIGGEAQRWDDVARAGDVAALVDRARAACGGAGAGEHPSPGVELDAPTIPEGVRRALAATLGRMTAVVAEVGETRRALGPQAEAVVRKALRSQVEKPQEPPPGDDLADDAFLAAIAPVRRSCVPRGTDLLVDAVRALVRALREAVPTSDVVVPDPLVVPKGGLRLSTSAGTVVLTGRGEDVHEEGDDVVLVIDLGGDDTWRRGASAHAGRPVSVCIDLAGDDRYVGRRDRSFGAALGGVAVQWDGGGNDLYDAGHASLGAAVLGAAVLVDEGGDDVYRSMDFGQGAGAFGVGVLLDVAGNDLRHVDLFGQGFASTAGCGVLADLDGHDVYDAGGAHSDAPLHRDRTMSLSQGFSIGMRPDASGGVGVLVDAKGNDRYTADIYGQGASYWFSLGLLVDDDGNDAYVLGHYGQGAGIHLSAGMLLDRAGQDCYFDEYGVGIGGAHDFAVGVLVDRGGDDHYVGSGGSQGGALTNSVAILYDAAGDDEYTAARPGASHGAATPARDTGGIGLLLDAGGKDVYSESARDGAVWTSGTVGAGLDDPTAPAATKDDPMGAAITEAQARARVDEEGTVAGPDGRRTDDLDKLWAIAIRWQVGDERVIGPIARERLVALGAPTLERMMARLGSKDGLEIEAVQALLPRFSRETVVARLVEATTSKDVAVRRTALRLLGTLSATEAEAAVVAALTDADVRVQALRALAAMKSAPPAVLEVLRSGKELEAVAAAACLGAAGGTTSLDALVAALAPTTPFLARLAAEAQLSARGDAAVEPLARAAADASSMRVRRTALRALGATKAAAAAPALAAATRDADPWVRFEARLAGAALVRALGDAAPAALVTALAEAKAKEEDPVGKRLR